VISKKKLYPAEINENLASGEMTLVDEVKGEAVDLLFAQFVGKALIVFAKGIE